MADALETVRDLVARYQQNADLYRRPAYNEAQVRTEFIDPLFAALGWDVHNREGRSPRYRDVIHEASLRQGGSVKAPDYAFCVGPERKFFVEAKKPSVDIAAAVAPAYQLRRYAWTAKLPLSILTDFEQFSVYDCRTRPQPGDAPATARIKLIGYREYPERWDEIAAVFGHEAVWRGDYDRFAEQEGRLPHSQADLVTGDVYALHVVGDVAGVGGVAEVDGRSAQHVALGKRRALDVEHHLAGGFVYLGDGGTPGRLRQPQRSG